MGSVRCRWTLCCSPQPIARFLRVFPKLALIFLVLHVIIMLYSVLKPKPPVVTPETKSSMFDNKVSKTVNKEQLKNLSDLSNDSGKKNFVNGLQDKSRNRTMLDILKIRPKIKTLDSLKTF